MTLLVGDESVEVFAQQLTADVPFNGHDMNAFGTLDDMIEDRDRLTATR